MEVWGRTALVLDRAEVMGMRSEEAAFDEMNNDGPDEGMEIFDHRQRVGEHEAPSMDKGEVLRREIERVDGLAGVEKGERMVPFAGV